MPLSLALFQPEIPQNTGTIIRLAACFSVQIHIIHPSAFPLSDAGLKRAGMDYVELASIIQHNDFGAFNAWRTENGRRLVLLTVNASTSLYNTRFEPDDVLMLGRESAGVPAQVHEASDLAVRIPMSAGRRSLNVAISAGMALGEAMRQTGTLPPTGN